MPLSVRKEIEYLATPPPKESVHYEIVIPSTMGNGSITIEKDHHKILFPPNVAHFFATGMYTIDQTMLDMAAALVEAVKAGRSE